MIYTEVLPFVWLGSVATFSFVVVTLALTASSSFTQTYVPTSIVWFCDIVHWAAFSRWWFWAPFLFVVFKISHSIATGRNCRHLQAHTNLTGKVAIVTGANSGIGYYTALQMAEMGATVILACRDETKSVATARKILDEIIKKRGGRHVGGGIANVEPADPSSSSGRGMPQQPQPQDSSATPVQKSGSRPSSPQQIGSKLPHRIVSQYGKEISLRTDLTIEMDDFVSVKRFVSRFLALDLPLHFLVNNAGMMVTDVQFSKFNPNLELHTAVNFLGPLLLTELLWEKLCHTSKELSAVAIANAPPTPSTPSKNRNTFTMTRSRVVIVASEAHQFPTMDPKLKWFDKVKKQPYNNNNNNNNRSSPMLSALKSANVGKENASGLLVNPSLSRTMAGFVRYGFSKLCDIYMAHYFVNKQAPISVLESLLSDEEKKELHIGKEGGGGFNYSSSVPASPKMKEHTHNAFDSTCTTGEKEFEIKEAEIRSFVAKKMNPKLRTTPLVVALHPGLINTNFANNFFSLYQYITFITLTFQKTPFSGSQTSVFACIANERDIEPHLAGHNPFWKVRENCERTNATTTTKTDDETSIRSGESNASSSTSYTHASRYLAECSDYSNGAMKPIAWSLDDARDIVGWAVKEVLKL